MVVHGRGALVSRVIEVPPELPDGIVDLDVPGLTVLAEGGTFRATAPGSERSIVFVKASLDLAAPGGVPGPSVERVEAIAARIDRVEEQAKLLRTRRDKLMQLPLDPALSIRSNAGRGKQRVTDTLAVAALVRRWMEELDLQIADLADRLVALRHERDEASLADAQARSADRMGSGHPTRRAHIRLEGHGAVPRLLLEYVVEPARWWPLYTLRLGAPGNAVSWLVEALVAQRSGEDWAGVAISFSTADLVRDARMPELPSLRLGRAQKTKSAGYRPAPAGLDAMFAAYDTGFPRQPPPSPPPMECAPPPVRSPSPQPKRASVPEADAPRGSAHTPSVMPSMPSSMPMMTMAAVVPPGMLSTLAFGALGGAAFSPAEAEPEPEPEIEPADAWLDFDSLRLASPSDRQHRGRLHRETDTVGASARSSALQLLEDYQPSVKVVDPSISRGVFDCRYEAEGLAEIPSDNRGYRVRVAGAESPSQIRYRTVPREAPEVFRELVVRNPFPWPLLEGPADVYLDGSLLVTTSLGLQDRGGESMVGLGVEDRIRVVRNVRVEEESAGLLRGSLALEHTVTIEIASSLGESASVEVVDRIPCTDDKDVDIKMLSAKPKGLRYTQAERGAPVRGGMSWSIALPPGGKETVECVYRITLPSKSELVGGNRRD